MKKKKKLEWDEFQAQMQQMLKVRWPLLLRLTFKILLGIIGIMAWGGVHPTKCMGVPWKGCKPY